MHPFGLYLAAVDAERTYGPDAKQSRKPPFAPVDAPPLVEPAPGSRIGRLTSMLRRGVARATSV